jgi:DnaJ-class molecular chaperone
MNIDLNNAKKIKCPDCNGKGQYFSDGDGWCSSMWRKCDTCYGSGVLVVVERK